MIASKPKRRALLAAALALTLAAGGFTSAQETQEAGWPRVFTNADGTTTEIPAPPQRILSTAVSITGTLLAVDAPVIASGAAGNGNFFAQWAPVAEERGLVTVWPAGSVDIEAAYAVEPDLIIVSTSGGDSARDQIEQFQAIAPTILLDYGGQTWQELAAEIGAATGLEEQVAEKVAAFTHSIETAAAAITVPEGTANIISFNGPGQDNPVGRASGAHAQLLGALGFTIEDPNPEWHNQANLRQDFVWAPYEKLLELSAQTTFVLAKDDEGAKALINDPVLANMPSVIAGQVYGLGVNSFRVDYFSATEVIDGIVAKFAK